MANDYEKTEWKNGDYLDYENFNKMEKYLDTFVPKRGEPGERGETGEPGIKGITGAKGYTGDRGATGDTGDKGVIGDKGETSTEQGPEGIKGPTGDRGIRGVTGPEGIKGPEGDIGPRGTVPFSTRKFFKHAISSSESYIRVPLLSRLGFVKGLSTSNGIYEIIIPYDIIKNDASISMNNSVRISDVAGRSMNAQRPFLSYDNYIVYGEINSSQGVRVFKTPFYITPSDLNRLGIDELKNLDYVAANSYEVALLSNIGVISQYNNLFHTDKKVTAYSVVRFRS